MSIIDWGDGSKTPDKTGFYKNRKPFCEEEDSDSSPTVKRCLLDKGGLALANTQLTCEQTSDCVVFANEPGLRVIPGSSLGYGCGRQGPSDYRHFGDSARACTTDYFDFFHLYTCTQEMIDSNADYVKLVSSLASTEAKEELSAMGASKVCVFKPRVQVLDNWGWCNGDCGQGTDKGCWNDGTFKLCDDMDARGSYTEYKGEVIVVPR